VRHPELWRSGCAAIRTVAPMDQVSWLPSRRRFLSEVTLALRPQASDLARELPNGTLFPILGAGIDKSFVVPAMALSGSAIATLKYWKDGAPNPKEPNHRAPSALGGVVQLVQ
jgi:hypothetical protein